jgi:hypothetical protein
MLHIFKPVARRSNRDDSRYAPRLTHWLQVATLGAAIIALQGCAPTKYYKEGSTAQDFNRDMARCRVTAAMVPHTSDGLYDAAIGMQTVRNCMIAQDWEIGKK